MAFITAVEGDPSEQNIVSDGHENAQASSPQSLEALIQRIAILEAEVEEKARRIREFELNDPRTRG